MSMLCALLVSALLLQVENKCVSAVVCVFNQIQFQVKLSLMTSSGLFCQTWGQRLLMITKLLMCKICGLSLSSKVAVVIKWSQQCYSSSHQCYMTVVPRVIVDQRGSVRHACYLVAVVPPRHHSGMLVCVLPQPIVGLPEVIQDVTGAGWES